MDPNRTLNALLEMGRAGEWEFYDCLNQICPAYLREMTNSVMGRRPFTPSLRPTAFGPSIAMMLATISSRRYSIISNLFSLCIYNGLRLIWITFLYRVLSMTLMGTLSLNWILHYQAIWWRCCWGYICAIVYWRSSFDWNASVLFIGSTLLVHIYIYIILWLIMYMSWELRNVYHYQRVFIISILFPKCSSYAR